MRNSKDPDGDHKKQLKRKKREIRREKRKRRHRIERRILEVIFLLILIACGIAAVKIYPYYKEYAKNVYEYLSNIDENTFTRSGDTTIYDASGTLIGKLGNEKYEYVEIGSISDYISNGYIAEEDKNFYTHIGVDFKATARAGYMLIKNKGTITQGGSTITQQVVKNNILSQEQTYSRKITEILLAIKIERRYDKAQIMEFYCNTNYYGNGCYGVESASQYYFGKDCGHITLAEAAILVGTSNSPNNYNPVADYDKAMEKKEEVLANMLECGYITQKEYNTALTEEPEIVQKTENTATESYQITYALHCATLKVMELNGFEFKYTYESEEEYEEYLASYNETYQEVYDSVRGGGYTIYTSLDSKIQKKLQKSINKQLKGMTKKTSDGTYELQAAGVCIDNESQMVVAVVGGRGKETSFNRGYQAKRQPGSSIKPLLDYGPALEEGIVTPGSTMTDKEVDFDGYSPKNSGGSYRGVVTIREALARSINTIAAQLYDETTPEVAMGYLDKLHFSSMAYADSTTMALSIGGFTKGVTVTDIARGYATIANNGEYSKNTCILSLESYEDGVIYTSSDDTTSVYSADTAFMLRDMMTGVFKESYGTAHSYDTDEQVYAGKTGTTNSNRDAWFCGFSAYYTTAVWVGCDDPKSVSGLYGNTYPLAIWSDFMTKLHKNKEKKEFDIPETIRLVNKKGKEKTVSYKKNYYASRPKGYDYTSLLLADKLALAKEKREQKKIKKAALSSLETFEDYRITSVAEAEALDKTYNSVVDKINEITDSELREKYLNRAAYKYDLLSGDVISYWLDAKEAQEESALELQNEANVASAQESIEKAQETYEESLRSVAEWYINHLNACKYYTSNVEQMILDGETALEKCSDLSDYTSLSTRFNTAKSYALGLPEPVTVTEVVMPSEEDYEE